MDIVQLTTSFANSHRDQLFQMLRIESELTWVENIMPSICVDCIERFFLECQKVTSNSFSVIRYKRLIG